MCSVALLATKKNDSQVGSGFNRPDNQEKTSRFGVSKTSSLLIFVPSGVACAVGSLFTG